MSLARMAFWAMPVLSEISRTLMRPKYLLATRSLTWAGRDSSAARSIRSSLRWGLAALSATSSGTRSGLSYLCR